MAELVIRAGTGDAALMERVLTGNPSTAPTASSSTHTPPCRHPGSPLRRDMPAFLS